MIVVVDGSTVLVPDGCGGTPLARALLRYLLIARPTRAQLVWVSRA